MSKIFFDLVSALKRIVNTVEDSYNVYEEIVKKISKDDLQFLNSVFSELNDPQDLISKYLDESYDEHGNFHYNFKKGLDDRKINTDKSKPYLSGHKYISTTEKFDLKDFCYLSKEIDRYDPLM